MFYRFLGCSRIDKRTILGPNVRGPNCSCATVLYYRVANYYYRELINRDFSTYRLVLFSKSVLLYISRLDFFDKINVRLNFEKIWFVRYCEGDPSVIVRTDE